MADLEAAAKLNHDSSKARGRLVFFSFFFSIIPLGVVKYYCTLQKVLNRCEIQSSVQLVFLVKTESDFVKKETFHLNDSVSTPRGNN